MKYKKCCRNCEHAYLESCKSCSTFGDNAYENFELRKELAKIESGKLVELPCKIGDTVYFFYSSEQRNPIPFVVDFIITHKLREEERLFVYDCNGYGGRFGDCIKGNCVWYIGTDKSQAEARLKELKGDSV